MRTQEIRPPFHSGVRFQWPFAFLSQSWVGDRAYVPFGPRMVLGMSALVRRALAFLFLGRVLGGRGRMHFNRPGSSVIRRFLLPRGCYHPLRTYVSVGGDTDKNKEGMLWKSPRVQLFSGS